MLNPSSDEEDIDESSPCGRRAATFTRETVSGFQKKSFTLDDGTTVIPALAYKMITDLGGVRAIEDAENNDSDSKSYLLLKIFERAGTSKKRVFRPNRAILSPFQPF